MFAETAPLLDTNEYPRFRDSLPPGEMSEGKFLIRFASSREELDEVQRLRFEVFNLELGEGLASSFQTGRDLDEYDLACHHLMVIEAATKRVVGTYRLQTGAMAAAATGFYSATEFDLSYLPLEVLEDSVELSRACIAKDYRNTQVLFLLWKGLASYIAFNRKRFLFGCCSLTSQDANDGKLAMDLLEREKYLHSTYFVPPKADFECYPPGFLAKASVEAKLPKLFRSYLKIGAKVCGPPAIDRLFKTIDFFVLFDLFEMDRQTQRMFFGV
ncbi:MAG TPA: GNAT family N-acyltransferase [Blastocatellia bacterium]|nr:GNAT family N-acyltransferase [Blastocatellia bacterium]